MAKRSDDVRRALIGEYRQLRNEATRPGAVTNGAQCSVGCEWEVLLVNSETGRPAPMGPELAKRVRSAQPEIGRQNLELNAPRFEGDSDVFNRLEQWQIAKIREVADLAGEAIRVLACPVIPVSLGDLCELGTDRSQWLTDKPRYHDLNAGIDAFLGSGCRPKKYLTKEGSTVKLVAGCSALNSANASFQVHLGGSIRRVVRWYNLALAISAAVEALAARSPFIGGHEMAFDSMRSFLCIDAIDCHKKTQRDQGLYLWGPGCFLNENNPVDGLLAHMERMVLEAPLLLTDYQSMPVEFPGLSLLIGQCWQNIARPVFSREPDGKLQFRLEFRFLPSACPAENTDNAFALICAILGLAEEKTGSDFCSYEEARANYWEAARYGRQAAQRMHGQSVTVREFWDLVLFPAISKGAAGLGVDPQETTQRIAVLKTALEVGRADILREKTRGLKPDEVREFEVQAYLRSLNSNMPIEAVV